MLCRAERLCLSITELGRYWRLFTPYYGVRLLWSYTADSGIIGVRPLKCVVISMKRKGLIMFRLIASFLILTTFVCIGFGQTRSGQEPWQRDWEKFGEAIAPYGREGYLDRMTEPRTRTGLRDFNRVFSRKVEWSGILRKFYVDYSSFLTLEMRPIQIPLKDGSIIEVKELEISCSPDESGCAGWSADLVGKEVIFRTKLKNRTRGNRPIVQLMSGFKRFDIQTEGAELVRVASKGERSNNSFNPTPR